MRRAVMTATSSAEQFRALILATALATGLLLTLVVRAEAAFPGFNSSIAFYSTRDGDA
jgi:hypothetical protein